MIIVRAAVLVFAPGSRVLCCAVQVAALGDRLVSVREVVEEARDKRTRDLLAALPVAMHLLEPSEEATAAGGPLPFGGRKSSAQALTDACMHARTLAKILYLSWAISCAPCLESEGLALGVALVLGAKMWKLNLYCVVTLPFVATCSDKVREGDRRSAQPECCGHQAGGAGIHAGGGGVWGGAPAGAASAAPCKVSQAHLRCQAPPWVRQACPYI